MVARLGAAVAVEDGHGGLVCCVIPRRIEAPVCGDRIRWRPTGAGAGVLTALEPRRSLLARPDARGRLRPLAANVDQLVVVVAPAPPAGPDLIDRYLIAAEHEGLAALLLLHKEDLLEADTRPGWTQRAAHYRALGYPVITASAHTGTGLGPLARGLAGRTSILVGQSGVGKSSLVNALIPDREARVGLLSAATGLGCHTTSTTTFYPLPEGGALIDSPGVRQFGLGPLNAEHLAAGFVEFRPYLGQCRFRDCRHRVEPGCALRAAVDAGAVTRERYERFLQIQQELAREAG
ncbi:MAG: ribosome small subunit-dependent GTPase A [Chromatiales bacterium 21-64-14]|nr:MAG: ribosome small subunit-dependent GTPase A [Chromatiales bacterium 21-64-14]